MTLFELFLIAALATYRFTGLLNAQDEEAGPGHILDRFRAWIGVRYDEKHRATASNGFAEAFLCPLCLSIWIALGVAALVAVAVYFNRPLIAAFLLLPFALSGITVGLRKFLG